MLKHYDIYPPETKTGLENKLSVEPTIHEGAIIKNSQLGEWTEIGINTRIEDSMIDDYTYDAGDVSIIYSKVGKFCSIASHVRINPGNHPKWRVMQHHCTYRRKKFGFDTEDDNEFFNWRQEHKCIIGHDVWIGHGAIVMPGIKIETGAVLGSGAVVTKDIGPFEIAAGVPARVIKKRFNDSIIEKLLKTEWWNWEREILKQRLQDFNDVMLFLEKYGQ